MMKALFNVPIVKTYSKVENGNTNFYIEGVASTTDVDRDTERMSEKALYKMQRDILEQGVNLFGDHEHGWESTLGVIKSSKIDGSNKLWIQVLLDDPVVNPKVNALLSKLNRGFHLGFSVGGNVTETKKEFDKALHKDVTIIDDLELYEVSLVGIPANKFCKVEGASASVSKSAFNSLNLPLECPHCYSSFINVHKGIINCDFCLTPLTEEIKNGRSK